MSTSSTTKRKLLVTGDYTYLVTLPKAWVKKLKWRAKQMVQLELKENSIIVRDFSNKTST
jgi:hypothetical protein